MAFLPTMGLTGIFELLEPYSADLLEKVVYTCVGIRSFSEIVAAGQDPLEDYYTSKGVDPVVYATDAQNGVCVVTLQAATGESVVYVPSSFIVGAPSMGGVPYTQVLVAADLGPVPDSLDLSYLQAQISVLIRDTIGVNTDVKVVLASLPTQITQAEHDAVTAARNALIANSKTDRAKLLEATTALVTAQEHIVALESFIIGKNLAPTP